VTYPNQPDDRSGGYNPPYGANGGQAPSPYGGGPSYGPPSGYSSQPSSGPGNYPDQGYGSYPSYASGGYASGPPQPTRLRGRTPRRLGWIFLAAAVVVLIVGVVVVATKSLGKVDDFQRVRVADGAGTINLEAGKYVAYYEADNVERDTKTLPMIGVQLTSPSGQVINVTTPYGNRSDNKIKHLTYDYDGHRGAAMYEFTTTEAGAYQVKLTGNVAQGPNATMAFGDSIATGTIVGGLLVVLGILLIVTAIVLLIVGYVKRSRHKRELAAGAPPWSPPPYASM
jgi:hypothetical protein